MSFLTAVIPTLVDVDGDYMKLAVESLRTSGFDGDIIVVANGTKDMNPFRDTSGISKAITVRAQGQCIAVNNGVGMVEGDCRYILVANADMYFAPGWLQRLKTYEIRDETNGRRKYRYPCMSPNLVEPADNSGSAAPFLKLDAGFTLDSFSRDKVDEFIAKHKEQKKTTVTDGFNLPFIIDVEVWRTIGGYDVAYDPLGSNSDTDLQVKINLAGIVPKRLRDVLVYHFSNKSGTFDGSHQEAWQRNWEYFQNKWGFNRDELQSDVWMNKNMLPVDRNSIKYTPDWAGKYLEV